MSKYGEASVIAAKLLAGGEVDDPANAWDEATKEVFHSSVSLQDKGCPRGAFLGLCNAGLIQGVSAGNYARASKNGEYALQAVEILKGNRFLASQPELLWKKVAGNTKTPNHQMDVVIGLWEAKRII
jgi:hypothetical protein